MSRRTKAPYTCGHCQVREAVEMRLTTYRRHGDPEPWPIPKAVEHLRSLCRCGQAPDAPAVADEVPEIRRPGKRILRPGVPVKAQLRRRPGTKLTKGEVQACHADGTVTVATVDRKVHRLDVEWVRAVNR